MKRILIYSGLVLVLLNTAIGLITSSYDSFNWVANNIIILLNMGIMLLIAKSKQKDGFKISLSFILPLLGLVQLVLGSMLENRIENNYLLIGIITIGLSQAVLFILGSVFSKFA